MLNDEYMNDPCESKCALDIAAMEEPTENAYLRRIWRHAFVLAVAGLDHYKYAASHEHSTVWTVGGNAASARVFDMHIDVLDDSGTEYRIQFQAMDGQSYYRWLAQHGGSTSVLDAGALV